MFTAHIRTDTGSSESIPVRAGQTLSVDGREIMQIRGFDPDGIPIVIFSPLVPMRVNDVLVTTPFGIVTVQPRHPIHIKGAQLYFA
jgi:hypothetical protein